MGTSFQGFVPSAALRALVVRRVGLLERRHPRVRTGSVAIERAAGGWRVEVTAAVDGDEIVVARSAPATAREAELVAAVRYTFDAVRRRVQHRLRGPGPPRGAAPPPLPRDVTRRGKRAVPDTDTLGDPRFRLDAEIGAGSMGRVYRGREASTGKAVAVKVMRRHMIGDPEVLDRFQLEADMLGRFDHPNILPLLGRGFTRSGSPWFATLYAASGSLGDQILRDGILPRHEVLSYIMEILDALQYLHDQGIVHRDVKPGNVLIGDDNVALLCDFGIVLAPDHRTTMVGDHMGTPSFMAPEQYEDPGAVTPQADLFGAGVTLFVTLTGQTGIMLLIQELRAGALSLLPGRLAEIVDRATSLRVEHRYRTATEMSLDLADVLDAELESRPAPRRASTARRTPSRTGGGAPN